MRGLLRGGWLVALRLMALVVGLLASPSGAFAGEAVSVGVLRFTSSGPVFLALDRGYFRDAGIDVEISFFRTRPASPSPRPAAA